MIGKTALIIKGKNSGTPCKIAYVYWVDKTDGFFRMDEGSNCDKHYIVIPHFDHCGEPKALYKHESEIKILK